MNLLFETPLAWPDGWRRTPTEKRLRRKGGLVKFAESARFLHGDLRLLGAQGDVIIKSNASDTKSVERLGHPGVTVRFAIRREYLFAKDVYDTPQDNLYSLRLVVGELRKLRRVGGPSFIERALIGFALPIRWTDVLGRPENWAHIAPETQVRWIHQRFSELAALRHPDMPNGSDVLFLELQSARNAALGNVGQTLPD